MWKLPGGMVEEGDTVEETAVKEAKEETGLNVELIDILGVYSDPKRDPPHAFSSNSVYRKTCERYTYKLQR